MRNVLIWKKTNETTCSNHWSKSSNGHGSSSQYSEIRCLWVMKNLCILKNAGLIIIFMENMFVNLFIELKLTLIGNFMLWIWLIGRCLDRNQIGDKFYIWHLFIWVNHTNCEHHKWKHILWFCTHTHTHVLNLLNNNRMAQLLMKWTQLKTHKDGGMMMRIWQ